MANTKTFVGLDVHAAQTQVAMIDRETGELRRQRITGDPLECLELLESLPAPVVATYEGGPTGYGLARRSRAGLEIRVCAPGSIPRKPTDKIKTDRRDAERIARQLLAGELSFVRVPSPEEERCRDLARCREAARGDLMRARHRLSKLLVRQELHFDGTAASWSIAHRKWLGQLAPTDPALQVVLRDYLGAVESLEQRRGVLDQAITELWPQSPWAETISRLRCFRGIESLTAFGLCAEIGDFERFSHPSKFAAYLGIVPREHSSGEATRRGPITKAGSAYGRRLLVETVHHCTRPPRISAGIERRQRGQDPRAVEIAWRCQIRLHQRWQRLRIERKRSGGVVMMALARELSNFVWEAGQLR